MSQLTARTHTSLHIYICACTQRAIIMEIAARTSIPYIKFIHVQPTAYIYSMQNPTAAQRACLRGGAAFWLISLSAQRVLSCARL